MSTSAMRAARAALRLGVLRLNSMGWRFGRRRFSFKTIAKLIAAGEAVREGDVVRAPAP